ncbi:MAG: GerMN domain-containing protein [Clostridiales bacterium]|nr:GerMN domain-containing protein [Clostridiales bacterium]
MTKRIIPIVLAAALALPAACTRETPAPSPPESAGTVIEYAPIRENTLYEYEGENISFSIYTTIVNGSRVQRRTDVSNGTVSTEVLQYEDGALKLIYGDPLVNFYEDITGFESNGEMLLLQEPLYPGAMWEADINSVSLVPYVDEPIETPYGNFETLIVATNYTDGRIQKIYYAKGVGVVRMSYLQSDETEIVINLKNIVEDAPLEVSLNVYTADASASVEAETRSLSLGTNADLKKILETELKIAPEGRLPLLTANTSINSITVDRSENALTLDLNQAFDDGSASAECLGKTLGEFYGVSRVIISVAGAELTTVTVTPNEG